MSWACAGSITSTLINLVWNPLLNQFCYIANADENVQSIKDKMVELEHLREDINTRIQVEERDGRRERTDVVQLWLNDVEGRQAEVNNIASRYALRGCIFYGSDCSFNCWSNYRAGKQAAKLLKKLEELQDKGDKFEEVTKEKPLPAAQVVSSESTVVGLSTNLEAAMRYLKDNDDGVLGIWGIGGVGKSTLLAEINNSLARESLGFDHVLHVVASRGCTTEKIQDDIIKQLNLRGENFTKAALITNYLIQKNFVLLLDDVWERLDLLEVGIPRPRSVENIQTATKHWKIIVVSRREDICSKMGAHRPIEMKCLDREMAWRLFEEKVGIDTINAHDSIKKIAEKIADECRGLPLALVVIGRAMSSTKTPQRWLDALNSLRSSQQLSGTEDELLSRLKLSYDYLENDSIRQCFLCCSLWPEDYFIPNNELIECWIWHGLICNFDDINKAYKSGRETIEILQQASLLEITSYSEIWDVAVKMHDVLRDMALWIACDCGANMNKWMVHAGLGLKGAPRDATKWTEANKISLMHNDLRKLPSTICNKCDNLTTLILRGNYYFNTFDVFQYFYTLKYLDLSDCGIALFPVQVCNLVNLEFLDLSESVPQDLEIPVEIVHLKNLKYLILRKRIVYSFPEGMISNLPNLLVLDVCNFHSESDDKESILNQLNDAMEGKLKGVGVNLSSVSDLQKVIKIPIYRLTMCSFEGEICLPLDSTGLLGTPNIRFNLRNLFLNKFSPTVEKLVIGGKHHPLQSLEYLAIRNQNYLKEIIWEGVAYKNVFPLLTAVSLYGCDNLKHATWVVHLPCLERLEILRCKRMNRVIDEEEEETRITSSFRSLRVIYLKSLRSLTSICSSAIAFPSLQILEIYGCENLKKLPLRMQSDNHPKLEKIICYKYLWEGLEWEDPSIKTSLQPFVQ